MNLAKLSALFDHMLTAEVQRHGGIPALPPEVTAFREYVASVLEAEATTSAGNTRIEVASILSGRTKEGKVELALNGETAQMDLPKAREVLGMLAGAIEAAVFDMLIYQFMTTKVGLSDEKASAVLLDFRELRQGSRVTVFPH